MSDRDINRRFRTIEARLSEIEDTLDDMLYGEADFQDFGYEDEYYDDRDAEEEDYFDSSYEDYDEDEEDCDCREDYDEEGLEDRISQLSQLLDSIARLKTSGKTRRPSDLNIYLRH